MTTVFQLPKKELDEYVEKQPVELDRPRQSSFRQGTGTRKPATIIHGAGTNDWFHNDLYDLSFILLGRR